MAVEKKVNAVGIATTAKIVETTEAAVIAVKKKVIKKIKPKINLKINIIIK